MKIRNKKTGGIVDVPQGMENQMKQHLSQGGDPMQLLGNKKKVKLNLKKHQQGGEQMQQQGEDQQAQMQQLVQMAEQALSQGANPQQVAQMLMQKGVPQEVVQQVIQAAMQDLQQQGQQQAPQEQMLQEQEMQQPQMNYGGYMQQGGLTDWWMQDGGKNSYEEDPLDLAYEVAGANQDNELYLPYIQPNKNNPLNVGDTQLRGNPQEDIDYKELYATPAKEVKQKSAPNIHISVVDYLASEGLPIDKKSRKAMAERLGIKNYDFSGIKNTELLKKLIEAKTKILTTKPTVAPRIVGQQTQTPYVTGDSQNTPKNIIPRGQYQQSEYDDMGSSDISRGFDDVTARAPMRNKPIQFPAPVLTNNYSQFQPSFLQKYMPTQEAKEEYRKNWKKYPYAETKKEEKPAVKSNEKQPKVVYVPVPTPVQQPVNQGYGAFRPMVPGLPSIQNSQPAYNMPRQSVGQYMQNPMMQEGGYMAEGGKHWIQGAVNPAHKGYCTPMTKATCTPKRKAFAKTMKKHHGFHQEGGFVKGQQYEMDDSQIANLRAMGYKIKEV